MAPLYPREMFAVTLRNVRKGLFELNRRGCLAVIGWVMGDIAGGLRRDCNASAEGAARGKVCCGLVLFWRRIMPRLDFTNDRFVPLKLRIVHGGDNRQLGSHHPVARRRVWPRPLRR